MNRDDKNKVGIQTTLLKNIEAAMLLGCAPETLKVSRYAGVLYGRPAPKYLKLGSRKIRYKLSTINEWLSQFSEFANAKEHISGRKDDPSAVNSK